MRPLTDICPKPLLEAGGKALIEHPIERLVAAGITDIVINHAHLGQMIEQRLGDGSRWGARLHYSAEQQALETAGGIIRALPLLGNAPFLVVNGDVFCDIEFEQLLHPAILPDGDHTLAHLVLVANPEHHPQGDFSLQHGRLALPVLQGSLTYSGIGLYHPALFSGQPCNTPLALGPLLRQAIAAGKVSGQQHPGFWLDVGTPERLAQLNLKLQAQS